MMGKLIFVALVKLDLMFNIDQRLADQGIDCWAHFLEVACERLYPDFDGEGFRHVLRVSDELA